MDPSEHRVLTRAEAESIRGGLETTALFAATVDGAEDGPLLVREEGMAWKPSILLTLSVADTLTTEDHATIRIAAVFIGED